MIAQDVIATVGFFALALLLLNPTGVLSLSHDLSQTESLPTVKDTNCNKHEFLANHNVCLRFTFEDGDVQYAGLNTFKNSKQAFKGDLYRTNGDKIQNNAITLTKHNGKEEILIVSNGAILYKLNADLETGEVANIDLGKYGGMFEDALPVIDERQAHPIGNQPLPNSMTLRLQILYDNSFAANKNYNEDDIKESIQRIVVHLQPFFHLASLTTRINLEVLDFRPIPYYMAPRISDLDILRNYVTQNISSIDADLYSAIVKEPWFGELGWAWIGSVCDPTKHNRTNIVRSAFSDATTALIMAHEIGHNLGMKHDSINSKNKACHGARAGGIMAEQKHDNATMWSPCSVNYFTKYYNSVIAEQGHFCLTSGETTTTTTAATDTTKKPRVKRRLKCNIKRVNNGICDDRNNHKGCFFDGNDCCKTTQSKPDWNKHCKKCLCKKKSYKKCVKPNLFGDGYCDDENNTPECNYDGGDCCNPNKRNNQYKNYCTACTCIYPKSKIIYPVP